MSNEIEVGIVSVSETVEKAAETTAAVAAVIPGAEEVAIVAGVVDIVTKAVEAEATPEATLIERIEKLGSEALAKIHALINELEGK